MVRLLFSLALHSVCRNFLECFPLQVLNILIQLKLRYQKKEYMIPLIRKLSCVEGFIC